MGLLGLCRAAPLKAVLATAVPEEFGEQSLGPKSSTRGGKLDEDTKGSKMPMQQVCQNAGNGIWIAALTIGGHLLTLRWVCRLAADRITATCRGKIITTSTTTSAKSSLAPPNYTPSPAETHWMDYSLFFTLRGTWLCFCSWNP